MKKTFFEIDYDQCSHLAMTLFMESAGINREGPKFERMRKDAFHMLGCIENRIELCGEYIFYDRDEMEFSGNRLSAGGQEFGCKAFKQLLDFDQLGIEVKESNIMVPMKSCAGLHFAVNDDYQHINSQCASCFGNLKSCKLCQVSTLNHGGIPLV